MKHHQSIQAVMGRRTRLATCLGLALALGTGSALAADPAQAPQTTVQAGSHTVLTRGQVSGESTLPVVTRSRSDATASSANSTAASLVVTNCDDSGYGSLRDAVDNANSGDTIDMSGLSCGTIKLNSSIVTFVDSLTLKGKLDGKYPSPTLDGQNTIEPLAHYGTGTITLDSVSVQNGRFETASTATGGCIYSSGNVSLVDSFIKYCNAKSTASGNGAAKGGAIISGGNVTLSGSEIRLSNATSSNDGIAQGGAIWSDGTTTIDDESRLVQNKATAPGGGDAKGGGIFSTGDLLVAGASSVSNNTASSVSGDAWGGGVFTDGDANVKYSQIDGNKATSTSGRGLGGGVRVGSGLLNVKYSTVADNRASSTSNISVAGGIRSGGDVLIRHTTISGNVAQRIGGLALSGSSANSPLDIQSSTVSGNTATESVFGAGIYVGHDTTIENSTITGNVESNADDAKYGAGISVKAGTNVELSSTIVSGNILKLADSSELPSDIDGVSGNTTVTLSGDYNLIGFTSISYPGSHTVQSFSPGLGILADNGGMTETHAVLAGSKAIDAGAANGSTSDQRGTGFARVVGSSADIGAFEMGADRIFADGFEVQN